MIIIPDADGSKNHFRREKLSVLEQTTLENPLKDPLQSTQNFLDVFSNDSGGINRRFLYEGFHRVPVFNMR